METLRYVSAWGAVVFELHMIYFFSLYIVSQIFSSMVMPVSFPFLDMAGD